MHEIAIRDPFHDMRRLMRRHFDDGFPRRQRPVRFGVHRSGAPALPLDVSETEDGLTIEAGVPGFRSDEVAVRVEGRTLTIQADHQSTAESTDASADESPAGSVAESYLVRERTTRALARSLRIGRDYDPESVQAKLQDGLLTVTVVKLPAAQSRNVEIAVS